MDGWMDGWIDTRMGGWREFVKICGCLEGFMILIKTSLLQWMRISKEFDANPGK